MPLFGTGSPWFTSVDDILQEFDYLGGMRPMSITDRNKDPRPKPDLDRSEAIVYECFRGGSILNSDTIAGLTRLPLPEVSAAVMALEIKRLLRKRADGCFESTL